jgi:cyanate permease
MMNRDNRMEVPAASDVPMWRPTVQSYRNLALFTSTLAVAAGLVLALTNSFLIVIAIAGLVLAAAVALSLLITRRRVEEALADALHPELGNWPGSSEERQQLRRAGRKRCLRSVAMAVVLGALGGFYPVVGETFVGIGVGGAIGSFMVMVLVQRYEAAHKVTVFTPSKTVGTSKRRFVFGMADGVF